MLTQASKLVFHFNAVRKKVKIFAANHPYVREAGQGLYDILIALWEKFPVITVSIIKGEIYVEGHLLVEESVTYSDLIAELAERELTAISFNVGLSLDELVRFIDFSNLRPQTAVERGGWEKILLEAHIWHVALRRLATLEEEEKKDDPKISEESYRWVIEALLASFGEMESAGQLSMGMLQDATNMLVRGVLEDEEKSYRLAATRSVHQYQFFHAVNVSILTLLVGCRLRLGAALLNRVGTAAILHDVGMIAIPEEVLTKRDPLTPRESALIKRHCEEGARILCEQPKVDALAVIVAAQHHARHDLSGYPDLRPLGKLHFLSELVAIADVFDALTSGRSHHKATRPDHAIELILENRGTQFDPDLAKLFVQTFGLFPPGSLVELDTGEVGVVVQPSPNSLRRPRVKQVWPKTPSIAEAPILDLTERASDTAFQRSIVQSLDPDEYGVDLAPYLA